MGKIALQYRRVVLAFRRRDAGRLVAEKLPELLRTAGEITRETEPQFLSLANAMEELHTSAGLLSRETGQRAREMREKLQSLQLTGEEGIAGRALYELQSELEGSRAALRELTEMSAALKGLQAQGVEMERLERFLKLAGYGFKVESSRHPECMRAFAGFVEDMGRLSSQIAELAEQIRTKAAQAHRETETTCRALSSSLNDLRHLVTQANSGVMQAAGDVETLLELSGNALEEAETRTRSIEAHVGGAMHYLQYGDILRQKLEHVERALQDLKPNQSENGAGLTRTNRSLAIQEAQLTVMCEQATAAKDGLAVSFSGIADEALALVTAMRRLDESDQGPRNARAPLLALREELRNLDSLRGQGRDLWRRAHTIAKRSLTAASALTGYLDQVTFINGEMHRQALNAVIMASNLGENGRTLAMLSEQIDVVFESSAEVVTRTAEMLESLNSRREWVESAAQEAEESGQLGAAIVGVEQIYEQIRAVTRLALAQADGENAALQAAHEKLSVLEGFSANLAELAQQIGEIRTNLEPWKDDALTAELSIDAKYTMASEREIHRQVLGETLEEPAMEEKVTAASDDEGVEFF